MIDNVRFYASLVAGLFVTGVLLWLTAQSPPTMTELALTIFISGLVVLMMVYSVPIGGGSVSLMPMMVMASYYILDRTLTGWVIVGSSLSYALIRVWRAYHDPLSREPTGRVLVERTSVNIVMHAPGILLAGLIFSALCERPPLTQIDFDAVGPLILAGLTYIGANYLLAAGYLALREKAALDHYVASLPPLFLFEGGPVIFSPLIAVVHNRLGVGYFAIFTLAMFIASLVSHDLAKTSRRLQRRVRELGSLQAVGQALSASLDVEAVVSAIYEQVQTLMPAPSFYVALYNAQSDEVRFPLLIEDGRRVHAEARRARRGLTEYVLETKQPLLLSNDLAGWIEAHDREFIGRHAVCWLGIPILAGDEILGVIAVQSYDTPDAYDQSHRQVLQAIAAQAAIAIQNARLYERTDEALARRVQELDSVLRTTREGILLIDMDWRVLAVNRALTDAVGIVQGDVGRHPVDALRAAGDPLIELIRYTREELREDCSRLLAGVADVAQKVVVLEPSGRHVERTLVPVYDRADTVTGWLLVFRDLTEEIELERLREDMMEMLVHDLRSPMSLVLASLSMMPESFTQQDDDQFERLVGIARRSSDRILHLINELMDISQLERGQLPLTREPTPISDLFREIISRYSPVATSNDIGLSVDSDDPLPPADVDRSLITRVLANLVDNALKFTPDGGEVALWARRDTEVLSGDLLVGVRDTGPGIPYEEMSRLFEKFQQVPNIRGRRRGTGLGLPFCKLAVEAHGGQIWVESEVDAGSTFVIRLPAAQV